jgi:hypothetical protein
LKPSTDRRAGGSSFDERSTGEKNMGLRFSIALITGAALAVSSLANATPLGKSPVTVNPRASAGNTSVKTTPLPVSIRASSISIGVLAQLEGILSYCAAVDPKSSGKYRLVLKNIRSGLPESETDDLQENAAFVDNEKAANTQLAKIPLSTGISDCRTILR